MINSNVSFKSEYRFRGINENNVQQVVLNLNSKKKHTFGNISIKILKSSPYYVCSVILQNIWYSEIVGKLCFSDNLKLAYITPTNSKKID